MHDFKLVLLNEAGIKRTDLIYGLYHLGFFGLINPPEFTQCALLMIESKLNLLRMFIVKGASFDYFCNFSQEKFENDDNPA